MSDFSGTIIFKKYVTAFVLINILLFSAMGSRGQSKLNYGLAKPQDAGTLPQSKASYVQPVLKPKVQPHTVLQAATDGAMNLTSGWELAEGERVGAAGNLISTAAYSSRRWYNATVPGTVLTTLVQQGKYPDPYFGLNNLHIPDDLCRKDWWYRIAFKVPEEGKSKQARLNFDGINYEAEIWLNGHQLGHIKGAFQQAQFEISHLLHASGNNYLAVHILPPPNPGVPHEESPKAGTGPNGGTLCLDGPTFISSEGWDWVPGIRDRNIGIWQNVTLKFGGAVTIANPQVVTSLPLPDTTKAEISIGAELHNSSDHPQAVTVKGKMDGNSFQQQVQLAAGETRRVNFKPLHLANPKLWWPNGYGKPNLYLLQLAVTDKNGTVSDRKVVRFGIRELSYELSVDVPDAGEKRIEFIPTQVLKNKQPVFDNVNTAKAAYGVTIGRLKPGVNSALFPEVKDKAAAPYLVIKVNGARIYCKGGNWGMDDAMKNTSREHLEPYFKLHRDAHFNMVRNWTGESTEQTFYDLCDEYGQLVWNDFWLSTQGYNLNVKDNALFMANAEAVVKRFRNHPSIAIWCPRNEGYAPPELEEQLSALIAREDGTRYYQPNSRYFNLRTSGPWHYHQKPETYYQLASGFSTELGTPSIPTAASIKKMMAKEDVWPISDVWYYHDFHDGQKSFVADIDSLYGKATSLEDFCRKAQFLNYSSHRAMFESWASKLWSNTSGLLLWMTHPAWPSTVWQVYSWDYETPASYFASKKACEPVHVQLNPDDDAVVVNTSLQRLSDCNAELEVYDINGRLVSHKAKRVDVGTNQLTHIFSGTIELGANGIYLVRLRLKDHAGNLVSVNDYWRTNGQTKDFKGFNNLPKVNLNVKRLSASTHATRFLITNPAQTPALAIKLNLVNSQTNATILPAYFSDGYFNLLPGESKEIEVQQANANHNSIMTDGYNVNVQVLPLR